MASRSGNKKVRMMNKKGRVTMNELPDEIVLSILSRLPMKEFARAGLVSRKWNHYWHHIHVLNFEDPIAFKKMVDALWKLDNYREVINMGRRDFIYWVNNVLIRHLGFIVVEFSLVFYLNIIHQPRIDKWVVWAFSKHVEKFKLDFTPVRGIPDKEKHLYVLDLPLLQSCNTKFHLTSLCLKYVDVTTQAMECFLNTCGPTLDYLCIETSNVLTSITDASLPSLKYLRLCNCPNIEAFHIQAPKLVSFKYYSGFYPVLRLFSIESASALSRVSIRVENEGCLFTVFRSLSKHFSRLEYLKLLWPAISEISPELGNFPAMANLKHLKLFALLPGGRTIAPWIPFIGACPLLQKLTLELRGRFWPQCPKIECHEKCPLLCLKTLEIKLFSGYNVDIDVANFVLQNAPALQEVILHISEEVILPLNLDAPLEGINLKLPPHVNLVTL